MGSGSEKRRDSSTKAGLRAPKSGRGAPWGAEAGRRAPLVADEDGRRDREDGAPISADLAPRSGARPPAPHLPTTLQTRPESMARPADSPRAATTAPSAAKRGSRVAPRT